jgi:hypothetical protein
VGFDEGSGFQGRSTSAAPDARSVLSPGSGDRGEGGGVEGVESGAVCVFSSLDGPQVLEGHMFAGRETYSAVQRPTTCRILERCVFGPTALHTT